MSSTKRRKIDPDTASNASGRHSGSNNAAGSATAASAAAGRRGGGGPGSRGGHSAATASRAAAAAATTSNSTTSTGGPSVIAPNSGLAGNNGNIPGQAYVPVVSCVNRLGGLIGGFLLSI